MFQLSQGSVKTGVDDGKNLQVYTGCVCAIGLVFVGSTYFFDFKYISGGKQGLQSVKNSVISRVIPKTMKST